MKKLALVTAFLASMTLAGAAPPKDADALLAAAKTAMHQNDAPRAASLLEEAVAIRPASAELHFRLGNAYAQVAMNANPFRQASLAGKVRNEYERAVQLDPDYLEARFGLVDFYTFAPGIMGGSDEKALAQAAEIRKRDSLQGHRAYARIYVRQKKGDLARKELADAIREQPASAPAHTALGTFLAINDKNYRSAFEELERALQLDSSYMPAWFRLGQAAAMGGTNYVRGEEGLRKYLVYSPKDNEPDASSAHYYLGLIFEKQGKKSEARQRYAAALRLAPGTKPYQEALKRVS